MSARALSLILVLSALPARADVVVSELTPSAEPRGRRSAAIAVEPRPGGQERIWVWGGFDGAEMAELAMYDTALDNWVLVGAAPGEPVARERAAGSWDPVANRFVVFGGNRRSGVFSFEFLNRVDLYNPATNSWTQPTVNGTPPAARVDALMIYVPSLGGHVVFGGISGSAPLGTTWHNDHFLLTVAANGASVTWQPLTASGAIPSPRASTCWGYDPTSETLTLFGGTVGRVGGGFLSQYDTGGGTFQLAAGTLTWTQHTPSTSPPDRGFAGCELDRPTGGLVLYGGQADDAVQLGDTWSYDIAARVWTQHFPTGTPGNLSDATVAYSEALGGIFMFGGRQSVGGSQVYFSTTWLIDVVAANGAPIANAGADIASGEGAAVSLNGTASADPDNDPLTFSWTQTGGAAVTLTGATTATPSFTTPRVAAPTALTFQLIVNDGQVSSAADTVVVNVADDRNDAPVANAGADGAVNENASFTLDGRASSDVDGSALSFSWVQSAGPAVTLSGANTAQPSFTAPSVAPEVVLTFSLIVNDGALSSAADTVDVRVRDVVNDAPIAAAGADQASGEGVVVVLDGEGSVDPNGDALSFSWSQIDGPPVTLSGATTALPSFTTPTVTELTTLVFRLVVSDGTLSSPPDDVIVDVADDVNEPPVANAGGDDVVAEGEVAQLDGRASVDPNGEALSFSWTQIDGPAVTLSGATTATPTFVAPAVAAAENLVFRLTVEDTRGGVASDDVVITINDAGNQIPVARATGPAALGEGDAGALDGTTSSDGDGDALSFSWSQTAGPAVTLAGANTATPSFTAPSVLQQQTLTFRLVVNDGTVNSTPATVDVVVNNNVNEPPVAAAGSDAAVAEGALVALDGRGSRDPNGDPLTFAWTQVSGPTVALAGANTATPSFNAPIVSGNAALVFRLVVADPAIASAPDDVTITVVNTQNDAPVAIAGADLRVAPSALFSLDGSASFDPDGDAFTFAWTQIAGPPVVIDDATAAAPSVLAPDTLSVEVLVFSLVVSDALADGAPDDVTVTVDPALAPPTIVSVARTIALVGEPWTYDEDGAVDAIGAGPFTLSVLAGPPDMTVSGLSPTFTPSAVGPVSVRLRLEGGDGAAEQAFTVDVYEKPRIVSTPSPYFYLDQLYRYGEDDIAPTAVGTPPLYWSLAASNQRAVMVRDTGGFLWIGTGVDPVTFTIRVQNAFGVDEQTFTLAREIPEPPRFVRDANTLAVVGAPYRYNDVGSVRIANVTVGRDNVLVVPVVPPSPEAMLASLGEIFWIPTEPGPQEIRLALTSFEGLIFDTYEFIVDVGAATGIEATAVITATPSSGAAPLSVVLDASESSGAPGAPILGYRFAPGDGAPEVHTLSPQITHTYAAGGYNAQITVIDAYGHVAQDKVLIAASEDGNVPPSATIVTTTNTGRDQLTVSFSCDCSDSDGTLAGMIWEYGDGESSSLASPTHTFVAPGAYRVRLTVFDDRGLIATDSQLITVSNGDLLPPAVRIHATPADGDSPMRVQFGADVEDADGAVVGYQWLLPDGTTSADPEVEMLFSEGGFYPVELVVTDDDGNVGRDSFTISVRRDGVRPPRIVSEPNRVAQVGIPWRYDADGLPAAQGDRPLAWRVGKTIDGVLVNAPDGMTIDFDSGELSWTPAPGQAGPQRVSLIAENPAGVALQEFEIGVIGGDPQDTPQGGGCACGAQSAGSAAPLMSLGLLLLLVRARSRAWCVLHSRASRGFRSRAWRGFRSRAWCLFVPALSFSSAAAAAPTITSTPSLSGVSGERWRYDDDGRPSASGDAPFSFSLGQAPADMVIDSVTGELFWAAGAPGTHPVELVVVDRKGASSTQRFDINVTGGAPPQILLEPPPGGYVLPAGRLNLLVEGPPIIPAAGDRPIIFISESVEDGTANCLIVASSGAYGVFSPFAGRCRSLLYAANDWGLHTMTIDMEFVDPVSGDIDEPLMAAAITASPSEGDAALSVRLDASASQLPIEEGWSLRGSFYFGDGQLSFFEGAPGVVDHVYTRPGTYVAGVEMVASRAVADLELAIVGFRTNAEVTIVVTEDELRAPTASLTVEPDTGEAPLLATFTTQTTLGDGDLVVWRLDYGDGDRFVPILGSSFVEPAPRSHIYSTPSWYVARLTQTSVVDIGAGEQLELSASVERDVIVTDRGRIPPFARANAIPARGDVPLTVTLAGEVGDLDGLVSSRHWILPDGSISIDLLPVLTLAAPGEHEARLVVVDDDGLSSTAVLRIEATRDGVLPPTIVSVPSRTAVVGQPYRYDEDARVTAVGGGPYAWSLGKLVDGTRVNAPAGMQIDPASGAITWTPRVDQIGEVPVTIIVENVAGVALQDVLVSVLGNADILGPSPNLGAPSRCACVTTPGAPPAALALALLGVLVVSRRRVSR